MGKPRAGIYLEAECLSAKGVNLFEIEALQDTNSNFYHRMNHETLESFTYLVTSSFKIILTCPVIFQLHQKLI